MPRQKGTVLSPLEKEILVELIEKNKSVLENRSNNAKILAEKENVWKELTASFNSRMGVTNRTDKQLKYLWKNIKSKAKTAVAHTRREQKRTGGGPPANAGLTDFDLRVCGILPTQIQSLSNPFDDDAAFHRDSEETTQNYDQTVLSDCEAEDASDDDGNVPLLASNADTCSSFPPEVSRTDLTCSQSASTFNNIKTGFSKKKQSCYRMFAKDRTFELLHMEQEEKIKFSRQEHAYKMESLKIERQQKDTLFKEKLSLIALKKQKIQKKIGSGSIQHESEQSTPKPPTRRIWNPLL